MQTARVVGERNENRRRRGSRRLVAFVGLFEEMDLAMAEVERGFGGFEETRLLFFFKCDAILDDEKVSGRCEWLGIGQEVVDPMNGWPATARTRNQNPDVRLGLEVLE